MGKPVNNEVAAQVASRIKARRLDLNLTQEGLATRAGVKFATYRSIFSREEAKTIKRVMEAFGKDREDYKAIGTFLMFTADEKEPLSNSEYCKATREVDDIAIGRYEQAQKRGNSMKL